MPKRPLKILTLQLIVVLTKTARPSQLRCMSPLIDCHIHNAMVSTHKNAETTPDPIHCSCAKTKSPLRQNIVPRHHNICYCCTKICADQVPTIPIDCCVVSRSDAYPNSTSVKGRDRVRTPRPSSPPAPITTIWTLHPGGASVESQAWTRTPTMPPLKATLGCVPQLRLNQRL